MIAKVSVKGQMVIPEAVREQAHIKFGDTVDIGYAHGLIVLRKRRPLTPARVRSLLLTGRELPDRRCVRWADVLTESAMLVFPMERASGATPDPNDEMVLECALAAEADVIVSGDKKHLLLLGKFRGIAIINPSEFLRRLPRAR